MYTKKMFEGFYNALKKKLAPLNSSPSYNGVYAVMEVDKTCSLQ